MTDNEAKELAIFALLQAFDTEEWVSDCICSHYERAAFYLAMTALDFVQRERESESMYTFIPVRDIYLEAAQALEDGLV